MKKNKNKLIFFVLIVSILILLINTYNQISLDDRYDIGVLLRRLNRLGNLDYYTYFTMGKDFHDYQNFSSALKFYETRFGNYQNRYMQCEEFDIEIIKRDLKDFELIMSWYFNINDLDTNKMSFYELCEYLEIEDEF